MKYKKKVENLKRAQAWWDKQPEKFKAATTRQEVLNNVLSLELLNNGNS